METVETPCQFKSPTRPPHSIPHQWVLKRCKNPNKSRCVVCSNNLGFLSPYEKCRSCKLSVHPGECKGRVNDNCGLTSKHFKELLTQMVISARQDNWAPNIGTSKSMNDMAMNNHTTNATLMHMVSDLQTPTIADSSSSTNSSAPSTPACYLPGTSASSAFLPNVNVIPPPMDRHPPHTANICTTLHEEGQFKFPEVHNNIPHIILPEGISCTTSGIESQGSDCTMKLVVSSEDGSEDKGDVFNDSQNDGNNWKQNGFIAERSHKWDRRSWQVHMADHFGTVAIKLFNMEYVEKERRLEAFKQDTACFQNARHENLVFFNGYTMDPEKGLGIVMELITGRHLHSILHDNDANSKGLEFNDVVDFAKQICQGIILHKDLRSRNIFITERKVVITDYGVFNVKKLAYPVRNYKFEVPDHWLCYLAPELVRALTADLDPLPFSEKSDVYAFGSIWFELLTNSFPFSGLLPDTILWQIGTGMKSPLNNVNCCREAKILLMHCWSFSTERDSFAEILALLESMPKKPIRRSPSSFASFPACKSFESIF
ncbi:protein tyrosine kinase domain-containing protein [Ditylenchus destructor]|uniref:Protein tyrosine kinase domain-containing protein n=1 Tax=Ditylenchus destructor TaxID=166010 RepID=A0AAD4NLP3_9BILA|nr:protein tyrosine kinase domain-containing protein [Ditylenchus destructor]